MNFTRLLLLIWMFVLAGQSLAREFQTDTLTYNRHSGFYLHPTTKKPIRNGVLVSRSENYIHKEMLQSGHIRWTKKLTLKGELVEHIAFDADSRRHGVFFQKKKHKSLTRHYWHGILHGAISEVDVRTGTEKTQHYFMGVLNDSHWQMGIPAQLMFEDTPPLQRPDSLLTDKANMPVEYTGFVQFFDKRRVIEQYHKGQRKARYSFENRQLVKYLEFDQQQKVKRHFTFKWGKLLHFNQKGASGRLTGTQIHSPNKHHYEVMHFVDGLPHGDWLSYQLDNSQKATAVMNQGLLTGQWQLEQKDWFYAEGKRVEEKPLTAEVADIHITDISDIEDPNSYTGYISYPEHIEQRQAGQITQSFHFNAQGTLERRQDYLKETTQVWETEYYLVSSQYQLNANGQKQGVYQEFDNGKVIKVLTGQYQQGQRTGKFTTLKAGQLAKETHYLTPEHKLVKTFYVGQKTNFISWLKNIRSKSEGEFIWRDEQWVPVGEHKAYYRNRALKQESDYTQSPAEHKTYFDDGTKLSHYYTRANTSDIFVGHFKVWYQDGSLFKDFEYDDNGKPLKLDVFSPSGEKSE